MSSCERQRITGLILAAGYSSRMGCLKPLLPLGDGNVIECITETLFEAGVDCITVVLGHGSGEVLRGYIYRSFVRTVYNPRYPEGMFTSVQAGISSMQDDTEAFLMWPVDCPVVQPETVCDIIDAYRAGGASIVRPMIGTRGGHPCLFSMKYKDEILTRDMPQGMRTLLSQHPQDILSLPVWDKGVLWDIDTPEEYRRLLKACAVPQPSLYRSILARFQQQGIASSTRRAETIGAAQTRDGRADISMAVALVQDSLPFQQCRQWLIRNRYWRIAAMLQQQQEQ